MYRFSKLENLSKKTKILFYNGGSVIPNGTISPPLQENWNYLGFGIGGSNGNDRMGFIVTKILGNSDTYLQFQGIKIHYNSTDRTLKVINNGQNLYYMEQYSCLT